jgi:hypothetical protein
MGGNALKNTKISRFNLEIYNFVKKQLQLLLNQYINIEYLYDVPEKNTFGDLDVLYQMKDKKYNIKSIIIDKFNPSEIFINGNVLSFAYKLNNNFYQVDMISVDNFESAKFFFSYGDIGSIIGKMLRPYNIHFGIQGLFVKPEVGGVNKSIVLTDKPNEICEFFNLKYEDWILFKSSTDIFEWIISNKYFDKNTFFIFRNLKVKCAK